MNNHLNITGVSAGKILSWNGSDYAWVDDQTGGDNFHRTTDTLLTCNKYLRARV